MGEDSHSILSGASQNCVGSRLGLRQLSHLLGTIDWVSLQVADRSDVVDDEAPNALVGLGGNFLNLWTASFAVNQWPLDSSLNDRIMLPSGGIDKGKRGANHLGRS